MVIESLFQYNGICTVPVHAYSEIKKGCTRVEHSEAQVVSTSLLMGLSIGLSLEYFPRLGLTLVLKI